MTGTPARQNPQMPGNDIPSHIRIETGEAPTIEETRPPRVETDPRRT